MKDHAQLQRSHRRKFLQRCDLRFLYGKLQIFTGGFDAHSYRAPPGAGQKSFHIHVTRQEFIFFKRKCNNQVSVRIEYQLLFMLQLQYRHLIPASVDRTSANDWL